MPRAILTILVLNLFNLHLFGQIDDDAIRQKVLEMNLPDSAFVFGEWSEAGGTETHLKYLGTIESNKETYKIMTSSWIWGLSGRATNRILVFTSNNDYIGNYYIGMMYELPDKIEENKLVFLNLESERCDENAITEISFIDGIPEKFFIECKNGYGTLYSFEKEN
ncbi:hypothetical protein [Flavilitoribacter nigricans]|uniref:Uncharacterized protein n=1 Tax=Flavilitoribacter nigricans (strain ATCC 23147 / DSM 23189 / NBRC 102662 / NCIMB 1420 / SS-2) TaxID=1122177 RepID=A0A2D0MWE9_FLAN2|nr:hypothetical protein [Flavilitoribacter nigricans]PHN00555.1 hypothetical protein CRP01_41630 [Flavilitoribacter nigricans DSM 23189 = NBRC 102662]